MCMPVQIHLNNSPVDRVKLSAMFPLSKLYHDQTTLLPNTSSVHRLNKFTLISLSSFSEDCVSASRELGAGSFETVVNNLFILWEMLVCAMLLSGRLQNPPPALLLMSFLECVISNDLWVAVLKEISILTEGA